MTEMIKTNRRNEGENQMIYSLIQIGNVQVNIFEHVGFQPIREQGINQLIKHFILSSVQYY